MNAVSAKLGDRKKGQLDRRGDELEHWAASTFTFGAKSRIRLYQRLERFTSRRIPLKEALESMWARHNRKKDARRTVFRRLVDQMAGAGKSFSDAIAPYIPAPERLMIYAGEEASRVSMGFTQAQFVATAVMRMRKALIAALRYPALLVVLLGLMLMGIAYQLVPLMLTMAPLEKWPPVSLVLYYVATGVQQGGPWLVLGGTLLAIVIARTLSTWTGPVRKAFDRYLPPWTIYREYQGSVFLISVSALIEAGRPIDVALKQIIPISRPWLRQHLVAMVQNLSSGIPPGRAVDTGLLSEEVCGDIEDYGSAGAFDQAIGAVGKDTIDDSIERITNAASMVSALMLLIVGASIVLVYTGMVFLVMNTARGLNGFQ